jgi:hypothetical protein
MHLSPLVREQFSTKSLYFKVHKIVTQKYAGLYQSYRSDQLEEKIWGLEDNIADRLNQRNFEL